MRLNEGTSPGKSLGVLLEKYPQHLAVKGFSESTLRVRRVHMEMYLKWCRRNRTTAPTQVTRTSLESYQRYLFHYRKKDGYRKYIPQDPAAELELPRVGYKLPNVMNRDEVERVLRQPNVGEPLRIRDRAMLEILYSSGLRRMELLHLKLYN